MKTITEYILTVDNEFHSIKGSLKEAKQLYKSLISVYEVEKKDCNIKLIKKTTKQKTLYEYETGEEPIFSIEDFSESVNF